MTAPMTFAWRNIVFAESANDAWAVYRVHTRSYAGLPLAAKLEELGTLA